VQPEPGQQYALQYGKPVHIPLLRENTEKGEKEKKKK
jgi:hypothetical protein